MGRSRQKEKSWRESKGGITEQGWDTAEVRSEMRWVQRISEGFASDRRGGTFFTLTGGKEKKMGTNIGEIISVWWLEIEGVYYWSNYMS